MDRLRRIEMLVHAAELGSFTRAAMALGLTPSAVSRGIAELEAQLRTTLFHRTTRHLRLTEPGMEAYRSAREVVDRLGAFEATGRGDPGEPLAGTLRVGVVGPVLRLILMPRVAPFLRRHPDLRLEFVTPTRPLQMEAGGMDLMLRVGPLPDSGLVARRRVKVAASLTTDDRDAMLAAVLDGAGIMRVGMFDPGLLASGALRRVLPAWTCPGGPALFALYRRTPRLTPKVVAFLAFAARAVADFDPEGMTLAPARR
jgi:DNA-binding transcriptional LysR family regulator